MGRPMINEIGNVYGKLTVISRADKPMGLSAYWVCKCECGNIKEVCGNNLRKNATKTCNHCSSQYYEIYKDFVLASTNKKEKFKIDKINMEEVIKYNWHMNPYGYICNYKYGMLHRFLIKAPKNLEVDHINGDRSDNRMINLRIVNKQQNLMNKTKAKGYYKIGKKYKACIQYKGKQIHIGMFSNKEEARIAYLNKREELINKSF